MGLVVDHVRMDFDANRVSDVTYVKDMGEVVQKGTHEELMAEGGLYAHLRALQSGRGAPGASGVSLG